MSQIEPKRCTLRLETGAIEFSPQQRCAFWEAGGAVLEGGCAIDRLGFYFLGPDVARYVLEARERVEQARSIGGRGGPPRVRAPRRPGAVMKGGT